MSSDPDLSTLVAALTDMPGPNVLVVTGAGISLASGIPTFRGTDPGAVWSESVTTMGTFAFFRRNPVESWRWYLSRFGKLHGKQPNAGHRALVDLERWFTSRRSGFITREDFLLVTQNIDGLHRKAGSKALVEVHGSADRVRCAELWCSNGAPEGSLSRNDVDFASFLEAPSEANLPRCSCGGLIRAHVLWFDETYDSHQDYAYLRVRNAVSNFELCLFVGTSFSVGVTELVLSSGLAREVPMFVIDPGEAPDLTRFYPGRFPPPRLTHLKAASEVVLPQLCRELGIESGA